MMLLYCAVGLAALNRMRPLMVPRYKAFLQTFADLFGFLEERLSGAEDLRANGATLYPLRQLFERFRGYMRIQRTALIWIRAFQGLSDLLLAIGTVLAFLLSAYLFKQHAITVATISHSSIAALAMRASWRPWSRSAWVTGIAPCHGGWTQSWHPVAGASRPARHSCWRWYARSWSIPAWWSWMKRPRAWMPRPSGSSSRQSTRCCVDAPAS
jgi:ABC-type multidrug transport system fused ATPase/permease subunit